MAREYFDEWFPSGAEFFDNYRFNLERSRFNNAAFQLHQASERYYNCALLVCSFYSPHVHNLAFLRTQAERIDPRIADAWPRAAKADRSRFAKLKEAYIKARYSKHFTISAEELTWIGYQMEID